MADIVIERNADGSEQVRHPSGIVVHRSREFVARMAEKLRADNLIAQAKRKILVDNNPCGFNCPAGRQFSCGCEVCSKMNGFFEQGEKGQFIAEDKQLIDSLWDEKEGYLGEDGCKLPRRLRPIRCLEYVCFDKD